MTNQSDPALKIIQPHLRNAQGGGSLLMTQAPIANITGGSSCWPPHRKGNYSDPIASVDENRVKKDSSHVGRDGCFEPFLQLASWGQGRFNPLAEFASRELLLGGVGGGERRSAPTEAPLGTRLEGKNTTRGSVMHAIRTREGGLEIAPAGGELDKPGSDWFSKQQPRHQQ